ncbi:MAG: T9SS type A sorting domain-containing protein [Flavobacteriales bacterium]|nr:T9SS type A sorting domain-containing protein [Flavobacteriales bacterium]
MRITLLPALFLVATTPVLAQPGPFLPADLQYALHVCGDTAFALGQSGPGEVADLAVDNRGCLVNLEQNGMWMHVQVATAGQLAFVLTPELSTDIDFAVWGPFTGPATALDAAPVRCSFAAGPLATGMNYTAVDLSESTGGDRWVRYLDVLPGEWYTLHVMQFSSLDLNFTLTWQLQGGASLACLEVPAVDFAGPEAPVLPGALVDFMDASMNHPYAWAWEFPGGEPATSMEQDPQGIVYTEPGCHDVQLTVYNAAGSAGPTAFMLRQEAGLLRVLPADLATRADVRVLDLRGRVLATTTGSGVQVVPLGRLSAGVYTVEVVQGTARTTQKIVREP